jgi:flagellar hook protein FlgE
MYNVDLAQAFTQSMITEKGYEVNLKTIQTLDQMVGKGH